MSRRTLLQRIRDRFGRQRWHNNDPAAGLSLLAELTDFVRRGMPFCHIRYGDGTFHCIMQTRQVNSDNVLLHPELGAELLQVLHDAARHSITDRMIFVGGIWNDIANRFLIEQGLWNEEDQCGAVPWCSANAFYDGLAGLQTKDFLLALRDSQRPKVLIGPERIAPTARWLQAEHIVVPLTAAWEHSREILPRLLAACDQDFATAIFAAGMVSDTWGWKVYREMIARNLQVIDIGHTFDACLGFKNRRYMQDSYFDHTLRDIVLREYSPLFADFR